jgi:hypothetical protein
VFWWIVFTQKIYFISFMHLQLYRKKLKNSKTISSNCSQTEKKKKNFFVPKFRLSLHAPYPKKSFLWTFSHFFQPNRKSKKIFVFFSFSICSYFFKIFYLFLSYFYYFISFSFIFLLFYIFFFHISLFSIFFFHSSIIFYLFLPYFYYFTSFSFIFLLFSFIFGLLIFLLFSFFFILIPSLGSS